MPKLNIAVFKMLNALDIAPALIDEELRAMDEVPLAKTNDRQVLGILNEFAFLMGDIVAEGHGLGPLYKREVFPDRATIAAFQKPRLTLVP